MNEASAGERFASYNEKAGGSAEDRLYLFGTVQLRGRILYLGH